MLKNNTLSTRIITFLQVYTNIDFRDILPGYDYLFWSEPAPDSNVAQAKGEPEADSWDARAQGSAKHSDLEVRAAWVIADSGDDLQDRRVLEMCSG